MADVSNAEIAHAATVLLTSVLHVRTDDRFVVIADTEGAALAEALGIAAETEGAEVTIALLDQLRSVATGQSGDRPHKVLPDVVRRALLGAQCSAFIASNPHAEASMREQLLHIVGACGVRHAHMPQLTRTALARGLALDYQRVETWGQAMARRLELCRTLETTSPSGTNLTARVAPEGRWQSHLGVVLPGKWASLPSGVLFVEPLLVEGVFVANASLGEFFGAREGLLLERPIRFTIEQSRVVRVEAPLAPELAKDVEAMLAVSPNSDRVGVVAIGVNVAVEAPTGEVVVDQMMPGLHLVIGDPAGKVDGSPWSARTSFSACQSGGRVLVDGSLAIENGKIVSVA